MGRSFVTKVKSILAKLWHWLRYEDENGNLIDTRFYPGHYSENIKRFPLKEDLTLDDILQISHIASSSGKWTTCFVTIKQLKDMILDNKTKEQENGNNK